MTTRPLTRKTGFLNAVEDAYRKHLNRTFGIIIVLELIVAQSMPALLRPLGAVAGTISVVALVWLHWQDKRRGEDAWRRWLLTPVALVVFVAVTFVIPQFA